MILLSNIPLKQITDGQLWISHYPGKKGIKDRLFQAEIDLLELKKKKIDIVVSLLKKEELEALQVSTLFDLINKHQFTHYYFPIEDKSVPKNKVELNQFLNELCTEIHKNKKTMIKRSPKVPRPPKNGSQVCSFWA